MSQPSFLDHGGDISPPSIIFTNVLIKIDSIICLEWVVYLFPETVYSCDKVLNNLKFTAARINAAVRNDDPAMSVTIKLQTVAP